jgi:hypothetical protein
MPRFGNESRHFCKLNLCVGELYFFINQAKGTREYKLNKRDCLGVKRAGFTEISTLINDNISDF